MLQISADISALTVLQREAIAGFILSFPTSDAVDEAVVIPEFTVDEDEQSPETAFTPVPLGSNSNLDVTGLPWDDRIHSSSRAKTVEGEWRKRRGVDDALVAKVEGELKALMAIPAVPVAESVAVVPDPTPVVTLPPPPPPAPVAEILPPAPPVDGRSAFVAIVGKAAAAIQAKKLTQEQLTSALNLHGIEKLPLLANRFDLIPQVSATLDAFIGA